MMDKEEHRHGIKWLYVFRCGNGHLSFVEDVHTPVIPCRAVIPDPTFRRQFGRMCGNEVAVCIGRTDLYVS